VDQGTPGTVAAGSGDLSTWRLTPGPLDRLRALGDPGIGAWGLWEMEKRFILQPPRPTIVIDLFPEILSALVRLLSSLSAEEWQEPTVCPSWSVQDVALHLLGGQIGNLSRRRDGHALEAPVANWEELVAFLNDLNQGWVQGARRISPRLLIDLLRFTGIQLCDYFRSLDPYALGGSVSWVGPEPAPVWLDLAREYTEQWHHQQHIRDAVRRPGLKEPRYMAPVLSAFAWALPRAFRSTPAAENGSVTLTIIGQSGGQWTVRRERGEWRLYQGAPDQADAEVILDEEIAWRLFTRGLSPGAAREHTAWRGDRALGLKVLEMVSIIA
jgi:uncharacterized protein (TIGR03083 family)